MKPVWALLSPLPARCITYAEQARFAAASYSEGGEIVVGHTHVFLPVIDGCLYVIVRDTAIRDPRRLWAGMYIDDMPWIGTCARAAWDRAQAVWHAIDHAVLGAKRWAVIGHGNGGKLALLLALFGEIGGVRPVCVTAFAPPLFAGAGLRDLLSAQQTTIIQYGNDPVPAARPSATLDWMQPREPVIIGRPDYRRPMTCHDVVTIASWLTLANV